MRIHNLTLLSLLLLASQMLTQKVKHGAKHRQSSTADGDPSVLDKAQSRQRSRTPKSTISGKFVSRDRGATCRWATTEQELGIALRVQCSQEQHKFSCVFAGNPTECLKHHSEKVYWKQIARTLHKQKNVCGDSKNVLKTKVCKKKFPESNFKLESSTLLENMKPGELESKLSPTEHPNNKGDSSKEPYKAKGDVSSTLAVTKAATTRDPKCLDDPDVEMQRKMALDFCGESWSSLCTFFLSMFQATSC
ncbi:PREDICTED: fibroblast growth factor-binding protein 1 [Chinchilla lanigera]|uniref:Fibroblast growth factor binding protein 1 n=2 Tax=Chinchilla lanigera TaxID=34839 RepID=A0A8C2UNP1_CHILA|nr:PREDICTED: fibroblast growth factor-binding protein 1 [Chinchilla lanigera]